MDVFSTEFSNICWTPGLKKGTTEKHTAGRLMGKHTESFNHETLDPSSYTGLCLSLSLPGTQRCLLNPSRSFPWGFIEIAVCSS